jgi:NAD(P)-dependent dehydrogenase (short-subunit alcohol dehydrogenase family)
LDGGAALIDAWHEVEAVVTLFRAALPAMENARYGRLILVGPIEIKTMTGRDAALDRTIGLGLLGMMKALSGEVGPEAITCNSVLVDLDPADPSERDTLIGSAAATVAYLASPHASFLTGLVIGVDRARSGSIF